MIRDLLRHLINAWRTNQDHMRWAADEIAAVRARRPMPRNQEGRWTP